MARRLTLADVAREAGGLHPSSVSLGLRNDPSIPERTRERIREAARRLGYRPDPLLDAFNTHRKQVIPHKTIPVIAFVTDFPSKAAFFAEPRLAALWEGARGSADLLFCKLELFFLGEGPAGLRRLERILQTRGIHALVLAALRFPGPDLALAWERYSAVRLETPQLLAPAYSVVSEHRDAARFAYRGLWIRGCRRIGLLSTGGVRGAASELHRVGFLQERRHLAGGVPAQPVLELGVSPEPVSCGLWARAQALDGLVADDATLLRAVLAQLPTLAPSRCALLDLDGPEAGFAGVRHDYPLLGAQAVEQVVSLLRSNQRGSGGALSVTALPVRWVDSPAEAAPRSH